MIEDAIQRIGAITGRMRKTPYPEQYPGRPRVHDDLATLFCSQLDALRAPGDSEPSVIMVEDSLGASTCLRALCSGVPSAGILWETTNSRVEIAKIDFVIGISTAEALIASSGSVMVSLMGRYEAFPSLLVDRHYVVSSRDKLVPDIRDFYDSLSRRAASGEALSNYVCITGCSRTADIEKMLIVPAHGPRQVRVILSRQPVNWDTVQRSFRAS